MSMSFYSICRESPYTLIYIYVISVIVNMHDVAITKVFLFIQKYITIKFLHPIYYNWDLLLVSYFTSMNQFFGIFLLTLADVWAFCYYIHVYKYITKLSNRSDSWDELVLVQKLNFARSRTIDSFHKQWVKIFEFIAWIFSVIQFSFREILIKLMRKTYPKIYTNMQILQNQMLNNWPIWVYLVSDGSRKYSSFYHRIANR